MFLPESLFYVGIDWAAEAHAVEMAVFGPHKPK